MPNRGIKCGIDDDVMLTSRDANSRLEVGTESLAEVTNQSTDNYTEHVC